MTRDWFAGGLGLVVVACGGPTDDQLYAIAVLALGTRACSYLSRDPGGYLARATGALSAGTYAIFPFDGDLRGRLQITFAYFVPLGD